MITRTKEEIQKFVEDLWINAPLIEARLKGYDWVTVDIEIKVTVYRRDSVEIELSAEYEPPGLDGKKLLELTEFFGTDNIRQYNESTPGCESCDWGSSYTFSMIVEPD